MKNSLSKCMSSKPGLNICHMNARSLVNKMVETKIMTLEHNIDILAVSETWFNTTTTVNESSLFGFQPPFRRDREHKRGGGTCIYVKNSIACTRRSDLEPVELEMVVVEVFLPSSSPDKSILICCCYRPPSSNLDKKIFEGLDLFLMSSVKYNIMMLWDFNAK